MSSSYRSPLTIFVQVSWLIAPIVITEPFGTTQVLEWLSFNALGPAPFGVALLVLLEALMIATARWRHTETKKVALQILLGWVVQSLGILLLWVLASSFRLNILLVVGILAVLLLVGHAVTLFIYLGVAWLGKKIPHPFFRGEWFPLCILFGLLVLWIVGLMQYEQNLGKRSATPGYTSSGDSTYDQAEIAFRDVEKAGTQLGRLPRPLKIFQTPTGYVGLTLKDEQISLPFLDLLGADPIEQVFFDIYTDTVYAKQAGVTRAYPLDTQTSSTLPEPIQTVLRTERVYPEIKTTSTPSIIAAHGPFIALLSSSSLAGTGEIAIYDVRTGTHLTDSLYLGYDQSRITVFWRDGKGYRLFLDGESPLTSSRGTPAGSYPRIGPKTGPKLYVYLDDYTEPFHALTHEETLEGMGKVVFGNSAWYTKGKTPLAEFTSSFAKERYGNSKFSVRNFYLLADGRVAFEIERTLLLLDLETKRVEVVTDALSMKEVLVQARLLSADDENAHHFINACGPTTGSEAFLKQNGTKFLFCLK